MRYEWERGEKPHSEGKGIVPIGGPMEGMYAFKLSDGGLDEEGELCLSGAQVTRGYWNNAAKTAEAFGTTKDGQTFYRTGDLCKLDRAGNFLYLGRIDNQVKIDGHRVELEEIEFHAATKLREENDYTVYDLIVSSFPPTIDWFRQKGIPAEMNRLGFEPRVLSEIKPEKRIFDVTFIGRFFTGIYDSRALFLELLCERIEKVKVWGTGVDELPVTSPIRRCYMVVGARTIDSHVPINRRPGKFIIQHWANILAKQKIPDINSGLRIIEKAVLLKCLHLMVPRGCLAQKSKEEPFGGRGH